MADALIWHPEAKEDFREVVEYLIEVWSLEIAENFTEQVDKAQQMILTHPGVGMRVGRLRSVRKIAVPPHHFLYYTFLNGKVWVLNVLDQRQNLEFN